MDTFQISTVYDLLDLIRTLSEGVASSFAGSLEEYLRALWGLIRQYKDTQVSLTLVGTLFSDAFQAQPVPFDRLWLKYDSPPFDTEMDDYAYLEQTILYQIADLHRMRQAGTLDLDPLVLFGGVDSPTGHRWFNLRPESYLECAVAGYYAHCKKHDAATPSIIVCPLHSTTCSWTDMAEILYLGQIYE